MYKLIFFVPQSHCEKVKKSLFQLGVGKIGNYDCCCWQTLGRGQFRPLQGATPAIGTLNMVEYVEEYKVEMVCDDHLIEQAIIELKKSHPYEEVAYEFFKINE